MWKIKKFVDIESFINRISTHIQYVSVRYEVASYTTLKSLNCKKDITTSSETGLHVSIHDTEGDRFSFSSNSIEEIERLIKKNLPNLKLKNEHLIISEIGQYQPKPLKYFDIPVQQKVDTIESIENDALLRGLALTGINYYDRSKNIYFCDSKGKSFSQTQFNSSFYTEIVYNSSVGRDNSIPISLSNYERMIEKADVTAEFEKIQNILDEFIENEIAPPTGTFKVLLAPELAGALMHETIGHLSEADTFLGHICSLNSSVSKSFVNVLDAPLEALGFQFDEEGSISTSIPLIENGVFKNLLYSKRNFNSNGTGNGRSVSYKFQPIPRMKQTYIVPGESDLDSLVKSINNGLYLCGFRGGNTFEQYFYIQSAYGYLIEEGKISSIFSGVNLYGDTCSALADIEEIGNDLTLIKDAGGCDKAGQNNLPNEMKSPSIIINNLKIGDGLEYE